ncbi:MAG: ribosome biogenesis GTPase Der, partial [Actinomycetota bacterium]|nr:ribosome biogenesis GTPase Der [Actinomycetota bacterium]
MTDQALTTHDADEPGVERVLRAGLEGFELSDEDRALLEADASGVAPGLAEGPQPVVAVVG